MKRLIITLFAAVSLITMVGCDWSTGGGVDGYNSRYSWVEFSGVYRGYNGGLLVTDFTATPGTPGVTNSVPGEIIASGNGSRVAFNGTLVHFPVVRGTLVITIDGLTLVDQGDGTLAGSGGSGSINYGTGAWSVSLLSAPGTSDDLEASYQYTISGTSGSSGAGSGATGIDIYSFTVFQQGENLTITDNNGSTYAGKMGNTQVSDGTASTPTVGTTVVMQFTVEGVSASGFTVTMVGTFQGVVQDSTGNQLALADRRMLGTWIELGGTSGDINGEASPIQINVVSAADTTPVTTTTP